MSVAAPSTPPSSVTSSVASAPPAKATEPNAKEPAASGQFYAVAAMGDSLTDPKVHGGKYLDYLRKRCPKSRFDSYGIGGEMVNQMRKRFAHDVLNDPPSPDKPAYSHVIVFGGVNDLYSDETAGRTVEKIEKDLGAMYDAARDRGLRVIAVTVAPWGGFTKYFNSRRSKTTRRLNAWIAEQKKTGRVAFVIDAYALLSCGQPERLCARYTKPFKDGIHFGTAGHEVLGMALYETVFRDCL